MTTEWLYQLMLVVPESANTEENREAFAAIFVNNGSGQSLEDERQLFKNAVRIGVNGVIPILAYGIVTPVKPSMRTALEGFLNGIQQAQWYATANVDLPNSRKQGELLLSSRQAVAGRIGTQFELQDALADLSIATGLNLQRIKSNEI